MQNILCKIYFASCWALRVASLSTAAIIISTPSTASSPSSLSSSTSLSSLSSKETACRMPFYYKRKGKQQNGANIVSSLGAAWEETVPSSQPEGSLLILHAAKRKHLTPPPAHPPPHSHLIIVILLVMLCGSCQAARQPGWLPANNLVAVCLHLPPGAEGSEGEGSRGAGRGSVCVAGRVHAAYAYCSRCQQLVLHPCEA